MGLLLHRIDDRLIHGQVVVGWGQPLNLRFLVLVDDDVAGSDWEQELYRMGVPPDVSVHFHTIAEMTTAYATYAADPRPGLLLVASVDSMRRLVTAAPAIRSVNLGGVHHADGRTQRLRYVFLTAAEEQVLRDLQADGVEVTAQDVPATRPVPLADVLAGRGDG
ncbi:MAG TPA: PTS sugar transporter subunit IIB [Gemmatimonadaceae bacterium]|nr:PTS sugar transporter subunit IIB [Gemmatimonadaceae bacterium]